MMVLYSLWKEMSMRKNQLIELLQKVKGNPEIVMWNGYVEDFQPLENKLYPTTLFKTTFEYFKSTFNLERVQRGLSPLSENEVKKIYDVQGRHDWELYSYYPPNVDDKRYRKKTVIMLEPKLRGLGSIGRDTTLDY